MEGRVLSPGRTASRPGPFHQMEAPAEQPWHPWAHAGSADEGVRISTSAFFFVCFCIQILISDCSEADAVPPTLGTETLAVSFLHSVALGEAL